MKQSSIKEKKNQVEMCAYKNQKWTIFCRIITFNDEYNDIVVVSFPVVQLDRHPFKQPLEIKTRFQHAMTRFDSTENEITVFPPFYGIKNKICASFRWFCLARVRFL